MDVTKPAIQIFYGKYLDAITNEIPADHIPVEKNGPFGITLEPGKPNFPTNDTATITLANLDADGTELYPKQWFIDESKSEAEGAVYPFELFFRVYTYGEAAFTGIYGEKKYSVNNDEVTISLNSIVGLLDKKDRALKTLKFNQADLISKDAAPTHDMDSGVDLNGNATDHESLKFRIDYSVYEGQTGSSNQLAIDFLESYFANSEILTHLRIDLTTLSFDEANSDGNNDVYNYTKKFSCFVKIKEQTVLTRVDLVLELHYGDANPTPGSFAPSAIVQLDLDIYHAKNTNETIGGRKVLQIGRFFEDSDGSDLTTSNKYDIVIHSPNRPGNSDCFLNAVDLNFSEVLVVAFDQGWIHGTRWDFTTGSDWEVLESELNRDYFDVFELTLDSISKFYKSFYSNPVNADFFDITNAGTTGRKAFIADALMFNWIGEKNTTKDLIVSLARQTNCYLYADAMGKIVYQSRSLHEDDYISETTPSSAVDLDSSDYFFSSGQTEDFGFDTFEIEVPLDIVEINNLVSDQDQLIYVNENGEAYQPGLRNTDLELSGFRIYDLAVPQTEYVDEFPLWRLSPSDPSFPSYTADLMDEFLQQPVALASGYAKRFVWPTEFIYPKLPGQHYPTIKEGGLMYRDKDGVRTIFLVTRIDRSTEMFKTIELKKEAEWEVM